MAQDTNRLKLLLTETVGMLCRNSVSFDATLKIQGLIAVTADADRIFVVEINSVFTAAGDDSQQKCENKDVPTEPEVTAIPIETKSSVLPSNRLRNHRLGVNFHRRKWLGRRSNGCLQRRSVIPTDFVFSGLMNAENVKQSVHIKDEFLTSDASDGFVSTAIDVTHVKDEFAGGGESAPDVVCIDESDSRSEDMTVFGHGTSRGPRLAQQCQEAAVGRHLATVDDGGRQPSFGQNTPKRLDSFSLTAVQQPPHQLAYDDKLRATVLRRIFVIVYVCCFDNCVVFGLGILSKWDIGFERCSVENGFYVSRLEL